MHETDGRFDYYGEQDYEITEALLPYTSDVPDTTPTIAETTSIKETTDVLKYKTPASCCTHNRNDWTSGIRYQNHTCDNYYEKGCAMYVKDFISEIILIASSVLLAIGVLQVRYWRKTWNSLGHLETTTRAGSIILNWPKIACIG